MAICRPPTPSGKSLMSATDQTWPVAARFSAGTFSYKNLYNGTFSYTETQKKVAAGTSTAILAATAAAVAQTTVTTGITQPDIPRALSVTPGGTTANILDSKVTVFGTNVEGKVISEDFRFAAASSSTVNGVKAFKSVTSVRIDGQAAGGGVTFAVGTQNIIGLKHRLFRNNTTVKVYTATAVYGALTLQIPPTVVANEQFVENNTVLPATIPNGNLIFTICYYYDNWSGDGSSVNDQPEYSTTTSTSSTSSSTSTTTITTSTSSTSFSTSSTSTSSTSTSLSTSSTSSSTTTAP